MQKMFKNCFSLTFTSFDLEQKYTESKISARRKYNLVLIIIFMCLSLGLTMLMIHISIPTASFSLLNIYFYVSVGTTGLYALLGVGYFIFKNNPKVQSVLSTMNYFLASFFLMNFRYSIYHMFHKEETIFLTFYFEMMMRLIIVLIGLVGFVQTFIINVVVFVMSSALAQFAYRSGTQTVPIFVIIIYTISVISVIVTIYFIIREQKKTFFYINQLDVKNRWYNNIFQNINTGFVLFQNGKVKFMNKILLDPSKSERHSNKDQNSFNEDERLSCYNDDLLRRIIQKITKCNSEDCQFKYAVAKEEKEQDTKSFFNSFKQHYTSTYSHNDDKFVYIGSVNNLINDEDDKTFEVSLRYYNNPEGENFEFILYDVTRTKNVEEKNAEIKYKSLFLSKVAHEFKNPIICNIELVEQVKELISNSHFDDIAKQTCEKNLNLIKSLSEFLIILVKDLDYVSEAYNKGKNVSLNVQRCELDGLLEFCGCVTEGIIKKANKQKSVKFLINKTESMPNIVVTDEIKLKQILINLISNSIKFTTRGQIELGVDYENNIFAFSVTDTGTGMTDEQRSNLFKPFSKSSSESNKLGTGLGLSIVKDLVNILGGTGKENKVSFTSELGKGTKFWFTLPEIYGVDGKDLQTQSERTLVVDDIIYLRPGESFSSKIISIDPIVIEVPPLKTTLTILVVDDEILTRHSTIRMLKKTFEDNNFDLNILEGDDGIETMFHVFKSHMEGDKLSFIVSDENMRFWSGQKSAGMIREFELDHNMPHVPFFLVTAYEMNTDVKYSNVDRAFTKPLAKKSVEEILKFIGRL